ncbi:hypothetical protein GUITHDRAFT_113953 [Guillardia theta CCMP2712]|uniref:SAM domain-containing protein n=1 Tax=Guillardia theta (strain CCMP2712) TaxID=905079 RepID=L1IUM2_GUITC|nr:hypothetical protein GUITHDRAFT_113953 [Guillardia theta CCMP2712]EKX39961.1 hypothetical protein GUITHDRAFT_113953 [Guillardia theta CCMP2712]|eukprot:XP_005826941.1 hypothetical protein GUITHDRAFT_113953 [Guillardia theta CCMP2712]
MDRVHEDVSGFGVEQGNIPALCLPLSQRVQHPNIQTTSSSVQTTSLTPPSPTIQTGKPRPLRSLRAELFHFFLSYRVSTEEELVEGLYDEITRVSNDKKPLPFGAKGTWPRCVKKPTAQAESGVKGFLDKRCLENGKDWEAGLVLGLAHSLLFVPVLSFYVETDETTGAKRFKGSLGELLSLAEEDRIDNVLLEYIIAIEWCRKEGTHLQSIFPILLGPRGDDGTFSEFSWSGIRMLPERPSVLTNERAAAILSMLDVDEKQIQSMKQRTIKQTVEMILKHQACKPSEMKPDEQFLDYCAGKILDVVIRDLERLLLDPNEFAFKTPGGLEVLQWLEECGLLGLSHMLVKHHVDSLYKAANLTDNDVHEMFASEREGQDLFSCRKGQEVALRMAIAELKGQKRSNRYSQRLLDFKDSTTAIGTAVWTTNAIEIVISKWQGQVMCAVLAVVCLVPLTELKMDSLTTWQSKDFGVILWFKVIYYLPLWASTSITLFKTVFEARYVRPHKACATLKKQIFRINFMFLIGVAAEIAQILAGKHQPGWTVADTLSVNGTAFELLMFIPASTFVYLVFEYREEFWIPSWLLVAFVLSVTYSYLWREYPLYFLMTLFTSIFTFGLFVYFAVIRVTTIRVARKKLGLNVQQYRKVWENCLQATSLSGGADHSSERDEEKSVSDRRSTFRMLHSSSRLHPIAIVDQQVTRGPLQQLWEVTSKVEEELVRQFHHCRSRVHPWKRFWQLRNKGFGRFKAAEGSQSSGKIRQVSSNLDQLYEQASTINSAVHDLLSDLLAPLQVRHGSSQLTVGKYPMLIYGPVKQPQRAIEKCVRSYRRDVGCLTDLVRCTIVAETVEQLLQVLNLIRERSLVGIEPANPADETIMSVMGEERTSSWDSEPLSTTRGSFHRRVVSHVQSYVNGFLTNRDRWAGDEERQKLVRTESSTTKKEKFFRITHVKNRFHSSSKVFNPMTGYRDLSLHLEVGWTFNRNSVVFLPVEEWEQGTVERYIIEVQIHLRGFYDIMTKAGFHEFYCEWRDMMSR